MVPRTDVVLPNLVLILVESWGKTRLAELEQSLLRPYHDRNLSERYTLDQGTVPFSGSTVAGEARELCRSSMGLGL